MSLDLFQDETQQFFDRAPKVPVDMVDTPFFHNFMPGGLKVMASELAKVGRSVSMAAGAVPVAADALATALPWLPGADMRESPTELQDRFFRQHDEVFGSAVKYWTPQPGEVGMAGEVVGSLAGMLPVIMANPALAVGSQVMSQAEDLVDKGVTPGKAVAVGVAQGAGLATGIWMPILGQNLWQRVVIGGAGFNAVQGVTTRAVSQAILGDDKAAELFPALGLKELTLDVLLGMAFGGVAHINPEMRAQGKDAWARIATWAQDLTPAQVDAIAALRQAEHLNVETAPGTLKTPEDVEANVNRAKAALEQVLRDEPVQVEQMPAPRVEPDTARQVDAETRVAEMMADAERVRTEEGIQELLAAEPTPARARATTEAEGAPAPTGRAVPPPPRGEAGEARATPEAQDEPDPWLQVGRENAPAAEPAPARGLEDQEVRDILLVMAEHEAERPAAEPQGPAGANAAVDPLRQAVDDIVAADPNRMIVVGRNPDGTPIARTVGEYLDEARMQTELARQDAGLFEIAARCMLGGQ